MKQLFLPDDLGADLARLLEWEDEPLRVLGEILDSQEGIGGTFSISEVLAERAPLPPYRAYQGVQVVRYLSAQRQDRKLDDDSFFSQLTSAYPDLAGTLSSRRGVLGPLFADKPRGELARKKERLSHGLEKTLVSIRGVCDIRPVFDAERKEIVDRVLVVLARMFLEDDRGDDETVLMQLNEQSIEKLDDFLETTKRKLVSIRKRSLEQSVTDAS